MVGHAAALVLEERDERGSVEPLELDGVYHLIQLTDAYRGVRSACCNEQRNAGINVGGLGER